MKKIIGLILVILIIISSFIYTQTLQFKIWFINDITMGESVLELESSDRESLIELLLKGESTKSLNVSGEKKTLALEPKIGDVKRYDLYFDYNYNVIQIFDQQNEVFYELEGPIVELLYMHDELSNLYSYIKTEKHELTYKEEIVETNFESVLRYTKADSLWHEDVTQGDVEVASYIVEDYLDMKVSTNDSIDKVILEIYNDSELIYTEENFEAFYLPEENGLYDYIVTSLYSGPYHSGKYTSKFKVEVKQAPKFELSSNIFEQGESITLMATGIELLGDIFLENDYWDQLKFVSRGDNFILVIPSSYYSTPGMYNITCGTEAGSFEFEFELLPRAFEEQRFTISTQTVSQTQNNDAINEYVKYYYDALSKDVYVAETSEFNGSFILPASGRVTTEFGVIRYINGVKSSRRHEGVDIAAPLDTPIVATYDGEIVLAQFLMTTGNTVVISHGNGIFSTYFHMNSLNVEVGEIVETGELIGAMGTTGFSTGSHLHFGVSYFRMNLAPGHFIYKEAITYNNYETLFQN